MPQLLTTVPAQVPPTSAQTARHRLAIAWLSDTPGLADAFTDASGNPVKLPWNEYTDVVPPSATGASISTLCEFTRADTNFVAQCGAGASYTVALRITVAMANIISARELLNDVVEIVDARLKSGLVIFPAVNYGGQDHYEEFRWERSPRSQGWSYTKDAKSNDSGTPGGKVTALGVFVFEGGPA